DAEALAVLWLVSVDEIARSHAAFSLRLYLQQFHRTVAAADQQAIAISPQLPGDEGPRRQFCRPDVERLAAKRGKGARPGLESTQPIQNLPSAPVEIDPAILAGQHVRYC